MRGEGLLSGELDNVIRWATAAGIVIAVIAGCS